MKHTYESLASATSDTLEQALLDGQAPDLEVIAGNEYRGWNTPFFASWVGILRFKKGFFKDETNGGSVCATSAYNTDTTDPPTSTGNAMA